MRSELSELRKEVSRLAKLVESSVETLRQAGARCEADRIEGELAGRSAGPNATIADAGSSTRSMKSRGVAASLHGGVAWPAASTWRDPFRIPC